MGMFMTFYAFAYSKLQEILQKEASTDEKTVAETFMLLAIVITAFMKLLYFFKIFEEFGSLIQLVLRCVQDIGGFSGFFVAFVLFFSILFNIVGMEFDRGDYSDLEILTVMVL